MGDKQQADLHRNEKIIMRFATILSRLYQGERLSIKSLAEEFNVSVRTMQRDFNDRLKSISILHWAEFGPNFYQLESNNKIFLSEKDIRHFAEIVSIQKLFPQVDIDFYHRLLSKNILVKGFSYEEIENPQKFIQYFDEIKSAIELEKEITFFYQNRNKESKSYHVQPYHLVNKNGIWYLIGVSEERIKTFCLSKISLLRVLDKNFSVTLSIKQEIEKSDSIYHGNQIPEVIIKVNANVAVYFKRRNLFSNQQIVREERNGDLIISCKNVNAEEIVPIVKYWIPHLHIVSPYELQEDMCAILESYIYGNI